jgi:transposase
MKTLSLDLRERILAAYDAHEGTREEIANDYRVSLGMVKKLLQQRRHTGDLRPRHHYSGRKPMILDRHRQKLRRLLEQHPDLTLAELRKAIALSCSLPAIHYALVALNLTYKKDTARQRTRAGRTSGRADGLATGVCAGPSRKAGVSG